MVLPRSLSGQSHSRRFSDLLSNTVFGFAALRFGVWALGVGLGLELGGLGWSKAWDALCGRLSEHCSSL